MDSFLTKNLSLQEFFFNKIREAIALQKLSVSHEVEYYLVNTLNYFSKSEHLFQRDQKGHAEYRALALKLYDAVFAETDNEHYLHLKSLGDTALYHAGVFYDGLSQQMIDVDYYINMGESAYHSLANLSTHRHKTLADIFSELSKNFSELVEVVHLCCEKEIVTSNHDLLNLLDRYTKTHSQKAKHILEEQGIRTDLLNGDQEKQ